MTSTKYFHVQNGNQIDIHYRAFPEGQEPREMTLVSNVKADEVQQLLDALNGCFSPEMAAEWADNYECDHESHRLVMCPVCNDAVDYSRLMGGDS